MSIIKILKDYLIKFLLGSKTVPQGLFELSRYCQSWKAINFKYMKEKDGTLIAVSDGFNLGSIVTSGKNKEELDKNVEDAILTFFEIPSSYAKEAGLHKVGEEQKGYAIA